MVSLDRRSGSCNTYDGLSSRTFIPTKTEEVNLDVFIMIIRIIERKKLTKYNSCGFKCELDGIKCNSNQKWSKDLCLNECKI